MDARSTYYIIHPRHASALGRLGPPRCLSVAWWRFALRRGPIRAMIDCSRPSLPNDGALYCLSHAPASLAAHGGKIGLCPRAHPLMLTSRPVGLQQLGQAASLYSLLARRLLDDGRAVLHLSSCRLGSAHQCHRLTWSTIRGALVNVLGCPVHDGACGSGRG